MRALMIAVALSLLLHGPAWSQASLIPDPTPRVPPQPGQGLPIKDIEFLDEAENLSAAQIDLARLAQGKTADDGIRTLAGQMVSDHEEIRRALNGLAQTRRADLASTPPDQRWQEMAQQLDRLQGEEFDRRFLQSQLSVQRVLADLYQTQASGTTDTELAKFAIETLAVVQRHRAEIRNVAERFDIQTDWEGQPPQYGRN